MPLKFSTVTGPDGIPRLNVEVYDEPEGWNLLHTGVVSGTVRTSDGALYDVTPPSILVASAEHVGEVNHHIGVMHEESGRYGLAPEPVIGTHPVTGEENVLIGAPHKCTEGCGPFAVERVVHAEHLGLHQDKIAEIRSAVTSTPEV